MDHVRKLFPMLAFVVLLPLPVFEALFILRFPGEQSAGLAKGCLGPDILLLTLHGNYVLVP